MSTPNRESAIAEAKEQGAKLIDGEWVFPKNKKKSMAKKMFNTHGSVMSSMIKSIRGKRSHYKDTPNWFKSGQGGGGLPPGRKDKDNE